MTPILLNEMLKVSLVVRLSKHENILVVLRKLGYTCQYTDAASGLVRFEVVCKNVTDAATLKSIIDKLLLL